MIWIALASLFVAIGTLIGMWSIYHLEKGERDIRGIEEFKSVLEALKSIGILSGMIDKGIEKGRVKKLSNLDKEVIASVTQKADKIDERFNKLMGDPSDYMKLGHAEYYGKNYKKAIEYYEKVIELKPDYVDAWVRKGHAFAKRAKLSQHERKTQDYEEKALKSYEEAIALREKNDPNSAWIWDYKGNVLRRLGRKSKADKAFKKAKELRSQVKECVVRATYSSKSL